MSETTLLNVSALPGAPIKTVISDMSKDLFHRGGLFELDGIRRLPHMTLFMARFHNAETAAAHEILGRLAHSLQSVHAVHSGFFFTKGNYYEVSYTRTDGLMALHYATMEALSPLRFSPGAPIVEDYFAPYDAAQRENAGKWGYDLADDLYRPHITITRFDTHPGFTLPRPQRDLSFPIERIGIFETDNLGATTRLLDSFSLRTS